jgi:NgoMIV restriction enzyme
MEPRPAMLRLIAYGSGSVDCVYHLALPELRQAAVSIETRRGSTRWKPRATLERMVAQGRVRSYGELAQEAMRLPSWPALPEDGA